MFPEVMVVKPSTQYEAPGWFIRFRYWFAKLIYDFIFFVLVRDGSWQEVLFASLAPKAGDRILDFGPGSSSTAISLALRYPEATIIGADPNSRAVEKARLSVARKQLQNISVIDVPLDGELPFDAGSFDKVVCIFVLHDRAPVEKLRIVRELIRVVRRGGTLHVADFDKPENPGEGGILEFARRMSGSAAAEPHINGSWTEFLAKGGFAGVRRQSSRSIGIGRISVVKGRKR
jgi:ubiquinone/menaquinone biosynthesis C-methylase UbiE